jgi:hypothetical protein
MRLEQIPFVLGGLVAFVGLLLILDAVIPDRAAPSRERRRRERRERHRFGEVLVGLGTGAVAAAFFGRDTWKYGTVAILAGVALLAAGAYLNRRYLRVLVLFRGAARRGEKRMQPRPENNSATTAPQAPVPVRRPTPGPRPIERERPIASAGLADKPVAPREEPPGPADTARRPRIR